MIPHTTGEKTGHLGYSAGCRCDDCKQGHRTRHQIWLRNTRREDYDKLVSSHRAKAHVKFLLSTGATLQTIADATGVSRGIICRLSDGQNKRIRRSNERKVLAVGKFTVERPGTVPGDPVREHLATLGVGSTIIGRATGISENTVKSIMIGRSNYVAIDHAEKLMKLSRFDVLNTSHRKGCVKAGPTRMMLVEMTKAGVMLKDISAACGIPASNLSYARNGRVKHIKKEYADAIDQFHDKWMEETEDAIAG